MTDTLTKHQLREIREMLLEFRSYLDSNHVALDESVHQMRHINEGGKIVRVNVHDGALISMLTSSVEVYPSQYVGDAPLLGQEGEVFGNLFGTVEEDDDCITYEVLGTSVTQTYLIRTEEACCPSSHHLMKIRQIADSIPGLTCLGRFHSHPYPSSQFTTLWNSHWSPQDYISTFASVREYRVPPLEMIFALAALQSEKKRQPVIKPSYIVSYCKNFKFVLRSFIFDVNKRTLDDVAVLRCQLAEKIRNW